MANTLKDREVTMIANVQKAGEKLVIPEKMTVDSAINTLMRFKEHEQQMVVVQRTFEVFPWDGAVALNAVLAEKYGWADAIAPRGFFGSGSVRMVPVETGYKQTVNVAWGDFALPGIDGELTTTLGDKRGRPCFALNATVRRKWEGEINQLFDEIQTYLDSHSIYQSKAISLDFGKLTEEGLVEPRFLRTDDIDPAALIYSTAVMDAVETNVFTPLIRYADAVKAKLPFKRGILLAGPFGVGKTLAGRVAAKHATDNGITFIDCPKASHLAKAVEFARVYEPCVIFCEDIDRETDGERTETMDTLLNIVDGVDSKNSRIMIVLTTNAVEKINPAMMRPGRLDAVIDVQPPDAAAIEKLLRLYGKDVIPETEDLFEVGQLLAGSIPAVVMEVVKRSKLAALKMSPVGTHKITVDSAALMEAAETMQMQLNLLYNRPKANELPTIDLAIRHAIHEAMGADVVLKDKVLQFDMRNAVGERVVRGGNIKLLKD